MKAKKIFYLLTDIHHFVVIQVSVKYGFIVSKKTCDGICDTILRGNFSFFSSQGSDLFFGESSGYNSTSSSFAGELASVSLSPVDSHHPTLGSQPNESFLSPPPLNYVQEKEDNHDKTDHNNESHHENDVDKDVIRHMAEVEIARDVVDHGTQQLADDKDLIEPESDSLTMAVPPLEVTSLEKKVEKVPAKTKIDREEDERLRLVAQRQLEERRELERLQEKEEEKRRQMEYASKLEVQMIDDDIIDQAARNKRRDSMLLQQRYYSKNDFSNLRGNQDEDVDEAPLSRYAVRMTDIIHFSSLRTTLRKQIINSWL